MFRLSKLINVNVSVTDIADTSDKSKAGKIFDFIVKLNDEGAG